MVESVKVQRRVGDIARSLISEDYRVMTNVALPSTYFIKLRHRFNGNCVSVVGNYHKSVVRMFKNGRFIKEEQV